MIKARSSKNLLMILVALLAAFTAISAQAHSTSQGWIDQGGGNLLFVLGSYDHDGEPAAEGSVSVNGQSFNFTSVVSTKPVGLVDGVNNFFGNFGCGGGPTGEYNNPDDSCTDTPVWWQIAEVTVTPTSVEGVCEFVVSGMVSVQWQDDNTSATTWSGSLATESCEAIPVPVPVSSTWMLVLLSLLMLGGARYAFARLR